jgi:hypothetical protein
MGEARRRKTLDPSFGDDQTQELRPIYHCGIDRAVETLLDLIRTGENSEICLIKQDVLMLTNDIPDHPDKVSMGFTATQIEELRGWVETHQHLIPLYVKIRVLPVENCIHRGRIWKSRSFLKLFIDL